MRFFIRPMRFFLFLVSGMLITLLLSQGMSYQAAIAQQPPDMHQAISPTEISAIQEKLRKFEQPTVLLYPLVLENRLELLLLTPDGSVTKRTVQISRSELNRAIATFRQALESPDSNPVPPAQQLYNWLIRPLEPELTAAGTKAILYAPDAALRYVPLAALHNGTQWLAQQWTVNTITAIGLTDFDRPSISSPKILAAAFSEGSFTFREGDRQFRIAGFPFAGVEVENIAKQFPGTRVLMNQEFSPQAVQSAIGDHNIIHLATTAVVLPGSPESSFLLFGNGERLTFKEMSRWNMSNVDLVVLSACDTAMGDAPDAGQGILGLGYQMQRTGAKSVIASLWAMSDQGTQVLMDAFYAAFRNGTAPAEALRQAQVSLIQSPAPRPAATAQTAQAGESTEYDFSHPYYWASFILSGNGLG
jgi:CHAT domain-containing protein